MTINLDNDKLMEILQTTLLIVIVGLLLWMQPWDSGSSAVTRTITSKGEATVKAEPDEYTFSPYFQRTGTDKDAMQAELTELANTAVAKLKELGVEEKKIKLDASSYENWFYEKDQEGVLSVSLTISLPEGDLVQKVQDYLLTIGAEGQITPQANFSEEKLKTLEAEATKLASEDAKKKAAAQAEQFDSKLGKVVKIENVSDDFGVYPIMAGASLKAEDSSRSSLPVLSGEQEVTLQVNATYELE